MCISLGIKKDICIVIPCYNEEKNLSRKEYTIFIEQNSNVQLCFVNDASTDKTLENLTNLNQKYPEQVSYVTNDINLGKAESVRNGIRHCNKNNDHKYIAYLDADLSTSLDECVTLSTYLNDNINFVFGSRIMKIGSEIVRNRYRFFVGRIIATIISNILKLKVYDTQCGCKIFTKEIAETIFEDPFISKWLFDVEIFQRIITLYGKDLALKKMLEIPLKTWIDFGDSKVRAGYFFKLWVDLYRINKVYKTKTSIYKSKSQNKNV